jgi:two-component system sensor histidine kinase SenX3
MLRNNNSKDRVFLSAILAIFVLALLWLGILLYRWATQLTEVTRMHIGVDLHAMMTNWQLEFYREMSDMPIALQVGPDSGAHDGWRDYFARYQLWNKSTAAPKLVRNVFIWETSRLGQPRLLLFKPELATLVNTRPPSALQDLLTTLQQNSANLPAALRVWDSNPRVPGTPEASTAGDITTGWQFAPDIPAVVHPIIHHPLPGDMSPQSGQAVDWILIVYDWEKIKNDLIPSITQEYFGNPEGMQFKLAVTKAIDQKPQGLIFTSDPNFGMSSPTDAAMNLFGPAPRNVESHAWQPFRGHRAIVEPDWQNLSGLIWFPIIQPSAGHSETWELRIGHRRDSLQGMIGGTRRRNLVLGLSVLGMLSLAVIVVFIASYRAHTLSRLQMQFVASVSHELRTPLAVLSATTENIADGIVRDPQRIAQYRTMISKQIRHLSHLVDQVLLFASSAPESGPAAHLSPVDSQSVLNEVLADLQGLIHQNHICLENRITGKLPTVLGDSAILYQCLQNLITNAVKYSGSDRWVGIEAEFKEPGEVQFTVRDHGLGIGKSDIQHIFKPFYRSPMVTAANIHGTGLGLSITKSLVEAVGGRITVESELGRGSAFTLHLQTAKQNGNIVSANASTVL